MSNCKLYYSLKLLGIIGENPLTSESVMKKIIFLSFIFVAPTYTWEWPNVSSYFKKKETEAKTQEFALSPDSTVFITNDEGTITCKGWNQNKIMVETIKKGPKEHFEHVRINITTTPKQITIAPQFDNGVSNFPIDFIIMVPKHCAQITAFIQKGNIKIKECPASLELSVEQGNVAVHHATRTVTAKTNAGNIKVKQKALPETETIFIEATKGNVLLKTAPKIHGNLQAKTTHGVVSSSVYITLEPQTTKLNKEYWARIKKEVIGALGNGGAPITIDVTRGNIAIEEL